MQQEREQYKLSQFTLVKTIGRGTFGKVCLALHQPSKTYHAMKILSLRELLDTDQVDHVRSERRLLAEVRHPFLMSLTWSCLDTHHLYLLCPFVPGGELFSYLRCYTSFPLDTAVFYLAETVCALAHLHARDIVFRDLKPENILLDAAGHIKITDFGFAKQLVPGTRSWTVCGTAEYMAPELVTDSGHTKCVDWWALGVLTFELLTGRPPFPATPATARLLGAARLDWPPGLEPDTAAGDFIRRLLARECRARLGHGPRGSQMVKDHKIFLSLDWEDVEARRLSPPIVPKLTHAGDTRNFEEFSEPKWSKDDLSTEEMELFKLF